MNAEDLVKEGLTPNQTVDVESEFQGETRTVRGFRVLPYGTPRGCVVAYFPEANPLVAVRDFAEKSRTPAFKSVVVRFRAASGRA